MTKLNVKKLSVTKLVSAELIGTFRATVATCLAALGLAALGGCGGLPLAVSGANRSETETTVGISECMAANRAWWSDAVTEDVCQAFLRLKKRAATRDILEGVETAPRVEALYRQLALLASGPGPVRDMALALSTGLLADVRLKAADVTPQLRTLSDMVPSIVRYAETLPAGGEAAYKDFTELFNAYAASPLQSYSDIAWGGPGIKGGLYATFLKPCYAGDAGAGAGAGADLSACDGVLIPQILKEAAASLRTEKNELSSAANCLFLAATTKNISPDFRSSLAGLCPFYSDPNHSNYVVTTGRSFVLSDLMAMLGHLGPAESAAVEQSCFTQASAGEDSEDADDAEDAAPPASALAGVPTGGEAGGRVKTRVDLGACHAAAYGQKNLASLMAAYAADKEKNKNKGDMESFEKYVAKKDSEYLRAHDLSMKP